MISYPKPQRPNWCWGDLPVGSPEDGISGDYLVGVTTAALAGVGSDDDEDALERSTYPPHYDGDNKMTAHLAFDGVSKVFVSDGGAHRALATIDIEIERGEFVALLGPSGCGKTTLLNIAAGLLRPTTGRVKYDGAPIDGPTPGIGYMTQKGTLLPWRTVRQNVMLPFELGRSPRSDNAAKEKVTEMIEAVNLGPFVDYYPAELSGGMRKRVALARALISDPHTLMMDEPYAALDAQLKASLQHLLLRIWEEDRKTVLFVTHDIEEAILLSDRIVVMGTQPGRIISEEKVPLPHPRNIAQIRSSTAATELWQRIWTDIGTEMTSKV